MSNRCPAFQFYPNDWLSSPHITLMSPAEEGAYIRLLCYAWADPDCSLPDDNETLARLSRLGEGWFKGGSTNIRKCFVPHPEKPQRLVNLRLLEERQKQQAWRNKSRLGGILSSKSRRSNPNGGSTTLEAIGSSLVEPNPNSSSSSSEIKNTLRVQRDTLLNGQRFTFEIFWRAYPKKRGRGPAEKAWAKIRPDDMLLGTMLAKIDQAKQTSQWMNDRGKFIPHPATWLNAKGWEDEYEEPATSTAKAPTDACTWLLDSNGHRSRGVCGQPIAQDQPSPIRPFCPQHLAERKRLDAKLQEANA